jgi:hypothetical protein
MMVHKRQDAWIQPSYWMKAPKYLTTVIELFLTYKVLQMVLLDEHNERLMLMMPAATFVAPR